jgi:Flp pilus assembly CpaF family ATPase
MTRKSTPAVMRSGFKLILPFLRPIEAMILDPDVTEIMVNGAQAVFVERAGQLAPLPDARLDERALRVAVKTITRALGDDISDVQPLLDARLPDAWPPSSRRVRSTAPRSPSAGSARGG